MRYFVNHVKNLFARVASSFKIVIQVFVVVALMVGTSAVAQDCRSEAMITHSLSYFEDQSNLLKIEEVIHQPFNMVDRGVYAGFSDAAIWVKLSIKPNISSCAIDIKNESNWLLKIKQPFHDYIDIYMPSYNAEKKWKVINIGDQRPINAALGQQRIPIIPVIITLKQQTDIFIRLQSQNARSIDFKLVTTEQNREEEQRFILISAFIGALFVLALLFSIVVMLVLRAWQMGYFIVFTSSVMLVVMFIHGWLNLFLPMGWGDIISVFFQSLALWALLMLTNNVLNFASYHSRIYSVLVYGVYIVFLVSVFSIVSGEYRLSLQVTQFLIGIYLILFVIFSLMLWSKEQFAKYYLLIFCVLFLAVWIRLADLHGMLAIGSQSSNVLTYALVAQIILMFMLVVYRFYMEREQVQTYKNKMAIIDLERNNRRTFMNLLSHELITPVTIIDITLRNLRYELPDKDETVNKMLKTQEQAVNKMRRMIELCLDNERYKATDELPVFTLGSLWIELKSELVNTYSQNRLIWVESIEIDWQSFKVKGDMLSLVLAVSLVVQNALKYSDADEKVFVSLTIEDGFVSIRVRDFGVGFPKDVFDPKPFYRGSNVGDIQGLGLGLALTQDILQSCKGTLIISPVKDEPYYDIKGNKRTFKKGALVIIKMPVMTTYVETN